MNQILLDYAEDIGVTLTFNARIEKVDYRRKYFNMNGEKVEFEVCFGADGAKSVSRQALINMPLFNLSQQYR